MNPTLTAAGFRTGSNNARLAELLLSGEEYDKRDLAEAAGAAVTAVPYVVKQLRLAGVDVKRRTSPRTGRSTYYVPVGGNGERVTKDAEVPDSTGPVRIRFVRGHMWSQVSIPGIGLRWGRVTAEGDLVDLQEDEPQ